MLRINSGESKHVMSDAQQSVSESETPLRVRKVRYNRRKENTLTRKRLGM